MIANKQTNMWNRDFGSVNKVGKKLNKTTCESRSKTKETKLRFLNKFMHMHEQTCMDRQDYAYAGFYAETLETQQIQ